MCVCVCVHVLAHVYEYAHVYVYRSGHMSVEIKFTCWLLPFILFEMGSFVLSCLVPQVAGPCASGEFYL